MSGPTSASAEERAEREERARLFVALELPGPVRDRLTRWTRMIVEQVPGMRPVPEDQLHLTLCFLGWQEASQIEAVAECCGVLAGTLAPALELGQPVWLPRRRPRVLGVGLTDCQGRLDTLQSRLSNQLEAGGWYRRERRDYLPHVTVARKGRQAGTRPSALPPLRMLPPLPPLAFTSAQATLFRSHLTAAGSRYEALTHVALRDTTA